MATSVALAEPQQDQGRSSGPQALSAVLCGSYRRDRPGLEQTFASLTLHYNVLSPIAIDFVDPQATFVRLRGERNEAEDAIEKRHLQALTAADFMWLFCPNGYVGTSAALEVGYAHAAGVPVLSDCSPEDPVLAAMVTVVETISTAWEVLEPNPGQGLAALQKYYSRIAERRGWAAESPRDTLLLLTEELGEVARAVRQQAGLARDGGYGAITVGHELADLQLYLVHLATAL
ncbi:MAG: hypothetical protein QOE92_2160, partial [Chloroflexota bacterium]|nr:hypothetical protein [Chloroflexota bacterium]